MAPPTPYPRAHLKKTLRAHTGRTLGKNVDILVFLNYTLFLQALVKEAAIRGKRSGERGITVKSLRKVRGEVLRGFRA
jgi:hypothetical protein